MGEPLILQAFNCKLSTVDCLLVEAGGESECAWPLILRNLFKNRDAKNAKNCEIASNWNVSGTRIFRPLANLVRGISLPR
jgi:hypothetical protein